MPASTSLRLLQVIDNEDLPSIILISLFLSFFLFFLSLLGLLDYLFFEINLMSFKYYVIHINSIP